MAAASGIAVSIHQPAYLPYGGYFAKLLMSDIHVVLDTVLYSRRGYQNRNRILAAGGPLWLTVPVHSHQTSRLFEVEVDRQESWSKRHWRTIVTAYGRTRTAELQWIRGLEHDALLVDVAVASLQELLKLLGRSTPIIRASHLVPCEPAGLDANDRLIRLVRQLGGHTYVAGAGGLNYMDGGRWRSSGLSVVMCDWHSPEYDQGPAHQSFVANLSIVDALMRLGVRRTVELIASGARVQAWPG